ncbi:MAG: RNA methyltransferase [Nocardioidaceae bacterium]|nr:RNA methyltransferase [Nocardioidaceae bacterium]
MTARSVRVKAARKLTRRASRTSARMFLAEGPQAVREALGVTGCVVEIFASSDDQDRHRDLHAAARTAEVPWHPTDPDGLATLTDTVSSQGVVAVCRFLDVPLEDVLTPQPRLLAVCVDVRDPGNAGSVIRCADAAGAAAVVLAGASVDPYNGKAVRASAGSLFHVPVVFGPTVEDVVRRVRRAGLRVLAADGAGDEDLIRAAEDGTLTAPSAWLFGNEAHGLSAADTALADNVVRVPIYGRAESLNLAAAVAVCLYASARAQRTPPGRSFGTFYPRR